VVRFVLILAWILVAIAILLPLLRRRPRAAAPDAAAAPAGALRDELVKDPVCHTYIARSRAVSVGASEDAQYFCSAECARRFAER
jgi:YHS domain-containing protein